MKKYLVFITFLLLFFASFTTEASFCADSRPDVQAYIDTLVKKYQFDRNLLDKLFCTVKVDEEVMTKLSKPAEAKPWYEYRKLVITPEKIDKGVAYWQTHEKTLQLAEKRYGVPASIIVAIIGVETKYGEKKGTYPVFNTLVTLAFNHNRRADFFRSELTQYLLLARENGFMPLELLGSYAGALGLPQFMPSSYRHYAVDFNNKGRADLFNDDADAIGSVGNYLKKHGWQTGEPVAIPATATADCSALIKKGYKPKLTEDDLDQYGVKPLFPLQGRKSCLIRLEDENGYEYWLGLQNFYVISTYNNSALYVMAVNQLAEAIRKQKYHDNHKVTPTIPTPHEPTRDVTEEKE